LNQFSDKTNLLLIIILAFIAVLPLFTTLNYPFQFDDYPTIFEDPSVDSMKDVFNIRLSERPIRKLSIIFDRILFKENVALYRIENILLYFLTIVLTALLILKITKDRLFALLSILLFGFHPVHMENILIITHRKELFLYIFSMLSFIYHIDNKRYISLIFFFLALLSKEVAIVLPVIFIIYDKVFKREIDKKLYYIYGGIFLLGLLSVTLFSKFTGFYLPSPTNMKEYFSVNRMLRDADYLDIIKIQPILFVKYMKNLIIPFNLNIDYYIPVSKSINIFWFADLILFIGYFIAMYMARKNRLLLFGMLFFAVSYIPLSNFIPVLNLFADRYLFFPSFALILIMFVFYDFLKKNPIVAFVPIIYYFIISISYMPAFKSETSLWKYVVSKNPESVVGTNNLGLYYLRAGDVASAEEYLLKAVEIDSVYANAYINLGTLYAQKRDYKKSMIYLEKAKDAEPENVRALYNLGLTYMNLGMAGKAQAIMKEIVRISPESSLAYNNLGASHFEEGMMYEGSIGILFAPMCYGLFPFFIDNTLESYLTAKGYFEEGLNVDPSYDKLNQNLKRINQKVRGE